MREREKSAGVSRGRKKEEKKNTDEEGSKWKKKEIRKQTLKEKAQSSDGWKRENEKMNLKSVENNKIKIRKWMKEE